MNTDSITIKLKISPNASKNEIVKNDNELKIKITAQPIENKANKALIEYLSKTLKIAKSKIEIVKGETSKEKTLLFKNISSEKILEIKSILT
ncbi:YggU family protein [bacterium]|nr:YggU family protein [bacterium]